MNYVYSPSKNAMYAVSMKDDYEAAGTWPADGIEISDDIFIEFSQSSPQGKIRTAVNGVPAWVDVPPPTAEQSVAYAENLKMGLLNEATKAITIWQTKLLMGRKLTDTESASLNAWMDYIDLLSAVDTTKTSDLVWPESP
jgi:hypothetical protein